VLLSMAGALVGILFADWGVSLLVPSAGINLPGFQPIRVDLPVLGFTFAVSLATACCSDWCRHWRFRGPI